MTPKTFFWLIFFDKGLVSLLLLLADDTSFSTQQAVAEKEKRLRVKNGARKSIMEGLSAVPVISNL